jgi:hypothetical protein
VAVTVRDRDAILGVLEHIRASAEVIYTQGCAQHEWGLSSEARRACDQLSEHAPAAATGFVNIVTCLTAKAVDRTVDCRYHREPGDGMAAPEKGPECYIVGRQMSEDIIAGWLT